MDAEMDTFLDTEMNSYLGLLPYAFNPPFMKHNRLSLFSLSLQGWWNSVRYFKKGFLHHIIILCLSKGDKTLKMPTSGL